MNPAVIIILALVFSAFFSGMEIAFITSNKLRIELYKKQGHFSSRFVEVFVKNPGHYITTILVGNNIALVIYGLIMAKVLDPVIGNYVSSETATLLLQTIISALLILIAAEFLPKTLFRIDPNAALNFFSLPMIIIFYVLSPVTIIISKLSSTMIKTVLKAETKTYNKNKIFNKVDLSNLIDENTDQNRSEENNQNQEIRIFQNALDFSKVKLRDCMIPRPEIYSIDINSSIEDLNQLFIESGYSKILVYKENMDNMVGYINCKELFKNPKTIVEGIKPLSYYPETMHANKLLKEFTQNKKGIAVVVDEFGGTSGLVTIEDVMEEIFGEIEDEHDIIELVDKRINANTYIFSGRLEIDYVNEKYNLSIPESDEYETIAGFILFHHESFPKFNDVVDIDKFNFKILKTSKTRLLLVRLEIRE